MKHEILDTNAILDRLNDILKQHQAEYLHHELFEEIEELAIDIKISKGL